MNAFFPIDNSFFSIIFEGDTGAIDVSKDVINFSLTEEIQKMITGQITLLDDYNIYSRILKNGKTFIINFGYKKRGIDPKVALLSNPDELSGDIIRRGLRCYIQSPGGTGASNGKLTYTCNFYGAEFQSNLQDTIWFRIGTKQTVILETFTKLGIQVPFVFFEQGFDQLTDDNAVLQNETPFKFLVRLAFEWRCVFKTGYTPSGQLAGLFVDNKSIDSAVAKNFQKLVTGGTTGSSKVFEYGVKSKYPNVISYSWKHNIGESGLGDGNRIEIINGKTVITNFTVEDQVVIISKLNEGRLQKYIKENPDQKGLLNDIIASNSLDSKIGDTTVRYFFDQVETTTAPQGLGYSANLNVIGDPLLSPTILVKFGNGFPDMFKNDFGGLNKFFIKKVVHSIDQNGYKSSVEVADIITTFGGFVT